MGAAISQAMANLPEKHRLIFVLKEIAGFKQEEIGEMLGMPVGTVKSLMYRAVKRLRHDLGAYRPAGIKKNERGPNEMQKC
jgi:RNA polymerase sigma-70 factor (ECF subfamily)